MLRAASMSLLLAIGIAGCVLAPVDLTGRPCPCAPGWSCVAGTCVSGDAIDASTDAGTDAHVEIDAPADAGTDAPGLDAPPAPDAGPDPTHCDDLYAGAIFCDGFEFDSSGSDLGSWQWTLLNGGGRIDTVTAPPARVGERAMEVEIVGPSTRAAVGANFAPGILDGELWLRGYYYFPSELVIDALSILYTGTEDGSAGLSLQVFGGGNLAVWIGTISDWRGTSVPMRRDVWTCLEMHIVVAEPAGSVEAYVDGVLVARHEMVDTAPLAAGGFAGVESGIEYSSDTQPGAVMYVDEVVLSRTRAPCDP